MSNFSATLSDGIVIIVFLLISSCATNKNLIQNYGFHPSGTDVDGGSYTSYFLIGNGGEKGKVVDENFEKQLLQKLLSANKEDYLILLGDNILNNLVHNEATKHQLTSLSEIVNGFPGQKLIIPGEREWNPNGSEGVERIEDYFEESLQEDNFFQPENGCPIETEEVDDDTEIIVVDSQWYISNWDGDENMNDKCEIKTRNEFLIVLRDKLKKAKHKNVLLLIHHPLYTNGIHGGYLPFSTIFKPSEENAYVPMVGLLWSLLRTQGGMNRQDRFNPLMNELMSEVEKAAAQIPRLFVLSAHDASLQYIEEGNVRQIISGAGSTGKGASLGKNGLFSSGRTGFSELRIHKDGKSEVLYFTMDQNNTLVESFRKEAFPAKKPYPIDSLATTFPAMMRASVYPKEKVQVDKIYEEKWGMHYRYVYGVEVNAPVAILDTLYGGLDPERSGGGNQTLSLRVIDKEGKKYNFRALAKDPISFLQASGYDDLDAEYYFEDTMPARLIEDFYTAAHPYGAFVISELSHLLNIKHTHPKLYYLPKQKALGNFNKEHGNRLYMLEQKPDGEFDDSHMFGRSEEVIDTKELMEALRDDEKNRVDEVAFIRARIFDMLLGDWDRHEGQWSWSKKEEGDLNIYSPVPRDRDQVFANFDGDFLASLQKFMGRTRQFGKYGPDIEFVPNFSESAINLDRAVIQRSESEVWYNQVKFIQDHLNKENVSNAFTKSPKEIQDNVWETIQEYLLLRKDNLEGLVSRYLAYYMDFQTLKGTDKDDLFNILKNEDGSVVVEAHRIKDGEKGTLLFSRQFREDQTEQIWIYGLDDKDEFRVTGNGKSDIKITLIGGLEEDTYDISNGQGIGLFDQKSEATTIKNRSGAKVRLNDLYAYRIYDTELRPSSGKIAEAHIAFNPDEGVVPTIAIGKEVKDFNRNPFTSLWKIGLSYISLTQAVDLKPEYHLANVHHTWNLEISGRLTSNNYTENFFGFGNNTLNDANNLDANRIYTQFLQIGISPYWKGTYGSSLKFGVHYRRIDTEVSDVLSIAPAVGPWDYIIYNGHYGYHSVDDENFPSKGLGASVDASVIDNTNGLPTTWALNPKLVFWNALNASRNLVLKNSFGAQLRNITEIPFYHAARLGADTGLRGYRQHRFTGQKAVNASLDMRYKVKPIRTALFPLRVTTYAGYDVGRVWNYGESSKEWHSSYGGGVEVSMAGIVSSRISFFNSMEGGRFSISLNIGI